MAALCDWVSKGAEPPPSRYPTLRRAELVPPAEVRFPTIPGVAVARIPAQPYRADYGPRWRNGIVDTEPPRLGAPYTVLVPKVDALGNDAAGIRSIELRVPLATYFPWHLRTGRAAGVDRLMSFTGTFTPLPGTERERIASGDSRPSIERLYGSRDAFLAKVDAAAKAMVSERVLLPGDAAAARARMAETWDWIVGIEIGFWRFIGILAIYRFCDFPICPPRVFRRGAVSQKSSNRKIVKSKKSSNR